MGEPLRDSALKGSAAGIDQSQDLNRPATGADRQHQRVNSQSTVRPKI